MSATMENLRKYFAENQIAQAMPYGEIKQPRFTQGRKYIHEYSVDSDYSYIRLHCIEREDNLIKIIPGTEDKWLIFVNSIAKGKLLKKNLVKAKAIKKDEVVFIDAQYEDNDTAEESVRELTRKNCISKKVVIATPVLDNGVSFHDENLRKIVIFTDTKEEFIQMLGRKRTDQCTVDLYMCARDCTYFEKRVHEIDRTLSYYNKHGSQLIQNHYQPNVLIQERPLDDIMRNEQAYQRMKKFCYVENGLLKINNFSIDRLASNQVFYRNMCSALSEDEEAFLNEQVGWLGLKVLDDIEDKISFSGGRDCDGLGCD